jgi:hypothetical protein
MDKIIRNEWQEVQKGIFSANILNRAKHPEGLDISRFFFKKMGEIKLNSFDGHILTILSGEIQLKVDSFEKPLHIEKSVHLYIPPNEHAHVKASAHTQIIQVSGPKEQARGGKLIVRDEQFLRATASNDRLFRWILTPQYLSRRLFLHHDETLLSKSNDPVSWFHTTMFDVKGLPKNHDGASVFKMSYDNQTEPNICFDVSGEAKVRMAFHPYSEDDQQWGEWHGLDNNTTYYLNEAAFGSDVEWDLDPKTNQNISRRNKHEVFIPEGGYVSLCCLFDPAPTGIERHLPGKYSSYEHVSKIIGTDIYNKHLKELLPFDQMLNKLSLQKSQGILDQSHDNPQWRCYKNGLKNQIYLEHKLVQQLKADGQGRDAVVLKWVNSS